MSYVIAFSNEGATDVTRRYVRNAAAHGAERNRCPEEVLMYIINEIRQMRREGLSKEEKRRIIREDQREERELRSYVVMSLITELEKLVVSDSSSTTPTPRPNDSEIKLPARTTGSEAWRRARNENGTDNQEFRSPREGEGH
jgi:peptide-N4-(N-acetyl-beta-glucosaminyl)asparagine amidase